MDAADAIPNLLQGFNRLASSIEDHVGWVEIDEQVIPSDVINELHQAFCRFLTRLKMKVLSICFAMVEEVPGDGNDILVELRRRVVGDEAEVERHHIAMQHFGEVRDLFHFRRSCRPSFWGDQADRIDHGRDVRVTFTVKTAEDTSEFNSQTLKFFQKGGCIFSRPG